MALMVVMGLVVSLPSLAQIKLEKLCTVGRVSDIRFMPNDDSLMYIVDSKLCEVRVFDMQTLTLRDKPFITVLDRTQINDGQAGLLSLVPDKKYEKNGVFYLSYVGTENNNVVAKYKAKNRYKGRIKTEKVLFTSPSLVFGQHFGGTLQFGPDGKLYYSVGDGGDKVGCQELTTPRGKIITIDTKSGAWEAVAIGLRNPWKFSFDPVTGDLWVYDVGAITWEELNVRRAGTTGIINFGWPMREGPLPRPPDTIDLPIPVDGIVYPHKYYHHNIGVNDIHGNCVVGGYVYHGSLFPELQGKLLFTDFMWSYLWAITTSSPAIVDNLSYAVDGVRSFTTFGVDNAGEMYLGTFTGDVYRLVRDDSPQKRVPVELEFDFDLDEIMKEIATKSNL